MTTRSLRTIYEREFRVDKSVKSSGKRRSPKADQAKAASDA
jgi:hypothetical protein